VTGNDFPIFVLLNDGVRILDLNYSWEHKGRLRKGMAMDVLSVRPWRE
jgi:hypothetical protein